jgi:DNA-binding Lrp family transcriptional regulator
MDDLDRRIAAALQLNGRAAWREIAAVVGTTESTVARRAQRLIDSGLVQIALSRAPACSGMPQVATVFVRTVAGEQLQVARTLADIPQVWYVGVYAGEADVICQVTVPSVMSLYAVLEREQHVAGVVSSVVEPISRTFKVSYGWARHLLPDNGAMLDVFPRPHTVEQHELTELDKSILELLREDPRMPFAAIAAELSVHQSTIGRRFESMRDQGCMNIATFVSNSAMGFQPPMLMKIEVAPGRLQFVAEELGRYAAVRYMAASLGRVGILAEFTLTTPADVYDFTTRVVGGLEGVSGIHVWTELVALKRGYVQLRLTDGGGRSA